MKQWLPFFFSIVVACCFASSTQGQGLKRPIKLIQEQDYTRAEQELQREIESGEEKAGAHYLMAYALISENKTPVDSALLFCKTGYELYKKLTNQRKNELSELGITQQSFGILVDILDSTLYAQAVAAGQEAGFEKYLRVFPDGDNASKAAENILQLNVKAVRLQPTKVRMSSFIERFPKTTYAAQFRDRIDSINLEELVASRNILDVLQSEKWPANHPYLKRVLPRVLIECQKRGSDTAWIKAARAYKDMPEAFKMWAMAMAFSGKANKADEFFEAHPEAFPRLDLRKWFEPWLLIADSVGVHCLNMTGDVVNHLPANLEEDDPILVEQPFVGDAQKKVVVNRLGEKVLPFLPQKMGALSGIGGENFLVHTSKDSTDKRLGLTDIFGTRVLPCLYYKIRIETPYLFAKTKRGTAVFTLNGVPLLGDSLLDYRLTNDTLYFETLDSSYLLPMAPLRLAAWNNTMLPLVKNLLLAAPLDTTVKEPATVDYKLLLQANKTVKILNDKDEIVASDLTAAVPTGRNRIELLKGEKFGIYFPKSGHILQPIYQEIPVVYKPQPNLFITKKGGKYGITNQEGIELTGHKYNKISAWNSFNALCQTDSGTQFLSLVTFKVTGSVFRGHRSITMGGTEIMVFALRGKYLAVSSNGGTIIPARHSKLILLPGVYRQMIVGIDTRIVGSQIVTAYDNRGTVLFSKELRAKPIE